MRIALLTYRGNMYCGGQGIYAAYLAREWRRAGHEVHVIAGPPFPDLDSEIPLHRIPNANVFARRVRTLVREGEAKALLSEPLTFWELAVSRFGTFPEMQTFGLRLLRRWRSLQRRHRFDMVFDNQSLSWPLLAIRASGVPVVSVIHHPLHIDRHADFQIDRSLAARIRRTLYFPLWMQERVAPRLDKIVTVSEASRREIERHFGIPQKEVAVVYNGTDCELFRPVPGQPIDTDLLFVGRTEDRKKGIGTLIEALLHLPESVRLKIVDGRIPEDGLVPRLLRKYGLEHRVVLVREWLELPELVAQYSRARIAVVPSFFEGFGFPASEAMACGLPVVANAVGALPEVVGSDGAAGRLVPAQSPRALAATLDALLADPIALETMGARARERVRHAFRWDHAAAELVRVFEDTLRVAHRRPRSS